MNNTENTTHTGAEINLTSEWSLPAQEKLIKIGENVTPELVEAEFANAEHSKAEFVVAAVRCGALLVAKREQTDARHLNNNYGFNAWLRENFDEKRIRSLRRYMFIGKAYLRAADAEAFGRRPRTLVDRDLDELKRENMEAGITITASGILEPTWSPAVRGSLEKFVAGRSLSAIIADLNEANKSAREDEDGAKDPESKDVELSLTTFLEQRRAAVESMIFGVRKHACGATLEQLRDYYSEAASCLKRAANLAEAEAQKLK